MDIDSANINTDEFLPSRPQKKNHNKGKKRTISSTTAGDDGEQMQVDDVSGIEGTRKSNVPKTKRKKQLTVEMRKVPVPSHRYE